MYNSGEISMNMGQKPGQTIDPGTRKGAPGDLAVVQSFINTADLRPGKEELGDPAALKAWFLAHGLLDRHERLTDADLRHALEVREALRDLLVANDDGTPSHAAIQTLSRAARGAHVVVQFDANGKAALRSAATGVDAALGRLLAITTESMIDGSWERLKACGDETCRWAFYDWSKNHSSAWCAMESCGNRVKARRYRSRQLVKKRSDRARDRR